MKRRRNRLHCLASICLPAALCLSALNNNKKNKFLQSLVMLGASVLFQYVSIAIQLFHSVLFSESFIFSDDPED